MSDVGGCTKTVGRNWAAPANYANYKKVEIIKLNHSKKYIYYYRDLHPRFFRKIPIGI